MGGSSATRSCLKALTERPSMNEDREKLEHSKCHMNFEGALERRSDPCLWLLLLRVVLRVCGRRVRERDRGMKEGGREGGRESERERQSACMGVCLSHTVW